MRLVWGSLLPASTRAERQSSGSALPSEWTEHTKSSADTWNAKWRKEKGIQGHETHKSQLINHIQFQFFHVKIRKIKRSVWFSPSLVGSYSTQHISEIICCLFHHVNQSKISEWEHGNNSHPSWLLHAGWSCPSLGVWGAAGAAASCLLMLPPLLSSLLAGPQSPQRLVTAIGCADGRKMAATLASSQLPIWG